jgi:hypothetical protein
MLEGLTPPAKIPPCMIRTVMNGLDGDDQRILRDALADHDAWSHRSLAKALSERGLPLGEKIIRERRQKACADCVCR